MTHLLTSIVPVPSASASKTHTAPATALDCAVAAPGAGETAEYGVSEAHCAFCRAPIVSRPGRRYCSGRCRARASVERRIAEAAYRERLHETYSRLSHTD